jgi:hypothetical protein
MARLCSPIRCCRDDRSKTIGYMRKVRLSMRVLDPKQASRCRESVRIEDYRGAKGYKYAYHSAQKAINTLITFS